MSFLFDLKIIFWTIKKVLRKENIVVRGKGKVIDFDEYRKIKMQKLEKEDIKKALHFFKDKKFNRVKTILQGYMGECYVDNIENPKIFFAFLDKFCFIDGDCNSESADIALKKISKYYKVIVANDSWDSLIEKEFKDNCEIGYRYSLKKNPNFNKEKLETYIENLSN